MPHRAFCIFLERTLEASYCFFMIVGIGPVQATIEPELGTIGTRRYFSRPDSEIKIVAHIAYLKAGHVLIGQACPPKM